MIINDTWVTQIGFGMHVKKGSHILMVMYLYYKTFLIFVSYQYKKSTYVRRRFNQIVIVNQYICSFDMGPVNLKDI